MNNTQNPATLDIARGNPDHCHAWNETPYNLVNSCYVPKKGSRITRVEAAGQALWQSEGHSSCAKAIVSHHAGAPRLAHLSVLSKGSREPLYFVYDEGGPKEGAEPPSTDRGQWRAAGADEFYARVHSMVEASKVLKELELTLGAKLDEKKIAFTSSPALFVDVFVPNVGFKLSCVRDRLFCAWRAQSPHETCVTVFGYPRVRYTYLHLVVRDASGPAPTHANLYLKRGRLGWNAISQEDYFLNFELEFGQTGLNGTPCNTLEDPFCYYYKNVQLCLDEVNPEFFYVEKRHVETLTNAAITPKPGFFLKELLLDRLLLRCADGETVKYAYFHYNEGVLFSFYLVVARDGADRVAFFVSSEGEWAVVSFAQYLAQFAQLVPTRELARAESVPPALLSRNSSISVRKGRIRVRRNASVRELWLGELLRKSQGPEDPFQGKLFVSSFRNANGLLIRTYFSPADNHGSPKRAHKLTRRDLAGRKNAILVPGIATGFMNQFLTPNLPTFAELHEYLDLNPYRAAVPRKTPRGKGRPAPASHQARYSEVFNGSAYYGDNLLDLFRTYCYEGSCVEMLNAFGYNVYGLDLASHGLSEAPEGLKCYVDDYDDYVDDLLQFVDIVKDGRFFDNAHDGDPEPSPRHSGRAPGSPRERHENMLVGYSMGANICLRAMMRRSPCEGEPEEPLVDRFVSVSGMYNVLDLLGPLSKRLVPVFASVGAAVVPRSPAGFLSYRNFGLTMRLFKRFNDPFCYIHKYRNSMTRQIIDACSGAFDHLELYPRGTRTLLVHTTKDPMCHVAVSRAHAQGSSKMYRRLGGEGTRYVQVNGDFHSILDYEYTGFMRALLAEP